MAAPPPAPGRLSRPRPAGTLREGLRGLGGGGARALAMAGLAAFLVSFDSAVLVLALPAISADFRTPVAGVSRLGSSLALGTLAALPIAMAADRVGRRRLLILAVAVFSLANLASAWSPSLAWLAASRVVAVCFESVAVVTATALVIEEVAAGARGLAVAAITVAAGAGTGVTTLLYPLLAPNWRVLYLAGGMGLAGAVVLALLLRESTAWTASVSAAPGPRRLPLRVLLEPPWRARLGIVAASAALGSLLYQPAGLLSALFGSSALGLDPAEISAVIVVSGVASVPAFVVGGPLSDRLGRRRLGAGLGVATAVATAYAFSGGRPGYWIGTIVWSVLASAAVPVLGAWYGELFPTRARATSEAAGSVAGAAGGAAGFQVVGALQQWLGLGHAVAVVAAGALLGAGLLVLLPETRGEPLEP